MRMHPILKIRRMHTGTDFVANVGTPVYAPGGGVVSFAGRRGGYGITLEIDHGFGYKTIFAHLSKILVKKGQKITRGDLIAESGNSGKLSTGPHLHYEVRHNGIALNPKNFMYDDVDLFEVVSR
jgi:murein DD-endopeptidase MepM/ murein hydrolase activator NlpD